MEMPYTYLMAWFVMHCSFAASNYSALDKPFLMEKYERFSWRVYYMLVIRRALSTIRIMRSIDTFPIFQMVGTDRCSKILWGWMISPFYLREISSG